MRLPAGIANFTSMPPRSDLTSRGSRSYRRSRLITLGMTEAGVPVLLDLVAAGCKVKATGFGRVTLDVPKTLEAIARKSPDALVFGTDLPSTRARRPFEPGDIDLIERVLGPELARRTFW